MANFPVHVKLTTTDKRANSTKYVESWDTEIECYIKDNTSIMEPTLLIRYTYPAELFSQNYFYIVEWNRFYFITNIESEDSRQWWVTGTIDLLATYREEILDSEAFVMYAESSYNASLRDSRLPLGVGSKFSTQTYPMVTHDYTGCFSLTVMSEEVSANTGFVQSYILDINQMAELAKVLNTADIIKELMEIWTGDISAAITSCVWIPFRKTLISDNQSHEIKLSGITIGHGAYALKNFEYPYTIRPYIPNYGITEENGITTYTYLNYLNVSPYTVYKIWLPGAGIYELPIEDFLEDGISEGSKLGIIVKEVMSPVNGDVNYIIANTDSDYPDGYGVIDIRGNLGVSIPITSVSGNFVNGILQVAVAAASARLIPEIEDPWRKGMATISAVESGVSGAISMASHNTTASGNVGGWILNKYEVENMYVTTQEFAISDSPSNIASTIGRPLHKRMYLRNLTGLVKCTGCFPQLTGATWFEQERLSQLVNSSTNFIYGGIIIE